MNNEALLNAYRWKRQQNPRFSAMWSHHCAREDVAADIRRYPSEPMRVCWQSNDNPRSSERLGYVESPEKIGLRLVGNVMPDCNGRKGYWHDGERFGWYADSYDENRIYGVVYQLPGRDGNARFVAGSKSISDNGVTIDFGTVFEEPAAYWEPVRKENHGTYGGYWNYQDNPREMDAALTAARSADHIAMREAEHEREYQTAWQAGNLYATAKEEIADRRTTCLELLADRRKARANGLAGYDAICAAIRDKVSSYLSDISEARAKMEKLASGDYETRHCYLGFFTGEERLRAAFNDGAGEVVLTA